MCLGMWLSGHMVRNRGRVSEGYVCVSTWCTEHQHAPWLFSNQRGMCGNIFLWTRGAQGQGVREVCVWADGCVDTCVYRHACLQTCVNGHMPVHVRRGRVLKRGMHVCVCVCVCFSLSVCNRTGCVVK